MDDDIFTSKWTWIAALAAFALLSIAVVYAFATHRPVRIGTDDDKLLSLNGPKNNLGASPYAYPPPKMAFEPLRDNKAKPAPRPKEARIAQNTKNLDQQVDKQQVSDMFPMGKVAEAPQETPTPQEQPKETFPTVTCAGRQWQSTGGFAAADQLNLIPSSCSIGERTLYALAGSGDNPGVLFAQSHEHPGKYAIYR